MAVKHEQEHQLRQRSRTRTYGWFDHGEKSLFPLPDRFTAQPERPTAWKPCPTHKLERHLPTIRFVLLLMTNILATMAILGPAITVSITSLRGVQLLCQHEMLSQHGTICNTAWTEPQQSILYSIRLDKTPLTATLAALDALNTLSPSLGFLGLPLFHANLNLSTMLADLEDSALSTSQLDGLSLLPVTNAGARAHESAEMLSSKEADFRRVASAWEEHGTYELRGVVQEMAWTLRRRLGWVSGMRESVYHVVPFLSKHSLSYKLLVQYHKFVSSQQTVVRELVMEAIETRLLLQDFLIELSRLDTQLRMVRSALAQDLETIRLAAAWALQVTRVAEEHYKTMYGSMHSWLAPLAADVASYDSWWLSRNSLSLSRLRAIVDMESLQLHGLHARAEKAEEALERLYKEFMTGGDESAAIGDKLEAAAKEGRVNWV